MENEIFRTLIIENKTIFIIALIGMTFEFDDALIAERYS